MIKSIIREHHLTPCVIDAFFLDAIDYHGIEWWYNDIIEADKQLKASLPKPKK